MKLIKTISLEFREGTSDKAYEVDLCEVGPDRFVVNFRYGRRGTRLRDGSKTPVPVARVKAERIFDDLVKEKVDKGYHAPGATPTPAPIPAAPLAAKGPADAVARREQAILARLRGDGGFRTEWKRSRLVWRAGELRLRAAEPLLWPFLAGKSPTKTGELKTLPMPWHASATTQETRSQGPKTWWAGRRSPDANRFLGYCAAWALGRCGSAQSIPKLRAFIDDPATSGDARRIALESIRLLLTPEERAEEARKAVEQLPAGLAEAIRRGSADEVLDRLRAHLNEGAENALERFLDGLRQKARGSRVLDDNLKRFVARLDKEPENRARLRDQLDQGDANASRILADLYWIDDERTRPALLAFLRSAPLAPNLFRFVRYVFKVASLRGDAEVFGVLTYRFETTRPMVAENWYRLLPFALETRGGSHPLVPKAYTAGTRKSLRGRAWKDLDRLGRLASPDYVRRAEQVLRHFRDEDGGKVIPERDRLHGWGKTGKATIDRFGLFHVFNRILYRNSPRYHPTRSGFFVCKGRYEPGHPAPKTREEAFPELWDRDPEALLRLLEESRCGPVHEFAARALRVNREFCRGLDIATVKRLAASRYEPTARLGMELAVERFDPARPDIELILILADSPLDDARRQVREWVKPLWGTLQRNADLVVGLVASRQPETQFFAREMLSQTSYTEAEAEPLVARLVALILGLGEAENTRANAIAATMLLAFQAVLKRVGEPILRDLLAHPLAGVQRLAGNIVLGHDTFSRRPPPAVMRALFDSPHAQVRAIGVKVLDQLGDDLLKQNVEVLVALLRHELADLRESIRATVRRLAEQDRDFGRRIAGQLVEALLVPGAPEGVPSHTALVLREDLRALLDAVPAETVLRLLQSRSRPAQEIGGLLLSTNVDPDTLTVEQLVALASNDILAIREAVWKICEAHPERLAADLRTAFRLADAKWEDSRRFAFALFRDRLGDADWPPEVLVGFCDSVKPDVQRFGQEMITRLFREEDGERYALELSEHPDASMQAFAGHFLDRFAADDPAHVRRLQFFCTVVLARVNRGRLAKERAFAFLEKAARSGEEAARVVAEVLARTSATAAVGDKARAIALMLSIHSTYPSIELPIRVRPAEVRHAV